MYLFLSPKYKKTIRIIVAVVAAVLMFFGAERAGAANTVYVPDNYSTIQQAVESVNSGDIIIVRDGCYTENILVNTSDLTIKSQNGSGHVFISATDPNKNVFELNRNRTTISGLTIEGATNASGIAIKYFSTENKITNNEFAGNEYGIHISLYSYLNEMTGNIFKETNDYGLYLQEAFDSGSGATRKSSANNIYLNDFYSKIFAGSGWPYYNFWKTGEEINYQYSGGYHKNRLGNYYLYYDGTDDNGDGVGEKPQALNGETDNYPLIKPPSNYKILTEKPDWTFAVITDLHIGWGIPDYGKPGYGETDNEPGQDYFMTDRLNRSIEWINAHTVSNNIKFVVILGDIADTAEYSEFLKARQILNQLVVPYIPIIGNHDIIPYVSRPMWDPNARSAAFVTLGIGDQWKNGEPLGDQYFNQVFWDDNAVNEQKLVNLFPTFNRQAKGTNYHQNYAFTYDNIKFVSLDFASREEDLQLFWPTNAIDPVDTHTWLRDELNDCEGKKVVLLTHYPLRDVLGGFFIGAFPPIENLFVNNSSCQTLNMAGHTHSENKQNWNNKYDVVETEALSQVALDPSYENKNQYLRLVNVKKNNDVQMIDVDNFADGLPSAINPFFTIFPGSIGVNQPVNFQAGAKNRSKEEILTYTWQFDDDEPIVTNNVDLAKWFSKQGNRKMKLTVKDIYGREESISWNFEVKEDTRLGRKMIMINGTFIPMLYTGVDLRDPKYAQNTNEWVTISKNDLKLIGMVNTHFELSQTDIDLSDLVADTDTKENKSFMHMDNWPDVIENNKILYIPSTGKGQVYICPQADSLAKVQPNCQDATILTVGETKNGMTVSQIVYLGQPYYRVYGITGTGGGELNSVINKNLEEQIAVTKLEYDGENMLDKVAADLGDKNPPLLLSELKQDKINLTKYLPEIKKILLPWQTKKLVYKFKFLESIGNEWQGKQLKVWFNFEAKQ